MPEPTDGLPLFATDTENNGVYNSPNKDKAGADALRASGFLPTVLDRAILNYLFNQLGLWVKYLKESLATVTTLVNNTSSALGADPTETNMGEYDGELLTDDQTAKQNIQQIATYIDNISLQASWGTFEQIGPKVATGLAQTGGIVLTPFERGPDTFTVVTDDSFGVLPNGELQSWRWDGESFVQVNDNGIIDKFGDNSGLGTYDFIRAACSDGDVGIVSSCGVSGDPNIYLETMQPITTGFLQHNDYLTLAGGTQETIGNTLATMDYFQIVVANSETFVMIDSNDGTVLSNTITHSAQDGRICIAALTDKKLAVWGRGVGLVMYHLDKTTVPYTFTEQPSIYTDNDVANTSTNWGLLALNSTDVMLWDKLFGIHESFIMRRFNRFGTERWERVAKSAPQLSWTESGNRCMISGNEFVSFNPGSTNSSYNRIGWSSGPLPPLQALAFE